MADTLNPPRKFKYVRRVINFHRRTYRSDESEGWSTNLPNLPTFERTGRNKSFEFSQKPQQWTYHSYESGD